MPNCILAYSSSVLYIYRNAHPSNKMPILSILIGMQSVCSYMACAMLILEKIYFLTLRRRYDKSSVYLHIIPHSYTTINHSVSFELFFFQFNTCFCMSIFDLYFTFAERRMYNIMFVYPKLYTGSSMHS